MYKQIIIPKSNHLVLHIPDNLVGQKVEVIAIEADVNDTPESDFRKFANERYSQKERLERLMQFIRKNPIRLPRNYQFNRDELYE